MAKYYRTEGICLRRIDYSNTSQVATFLTPDAGRLSFLAKGVTRAPKRGVRSGFDLLGRYELIYTQRRIGSLLNLTQRHLLESFRGIRRSLEQIVCAYYAAELILNFTPEGEPCPRLHEVCLESVRRFERGQSLGLSVLSLEVATLQEQGSCPTFDVCVECDKELKSSGYLLFSPRRGGPLCVPCGRRLHQGPSSQALRVHAKHLAFLRSLAAQPLCPAEDARADPQQIVAASRVLRSLMREMLGKELRMWKYLQERHLSRALRRIRPPATPPRPAGADRSGR